MPGGGTQPYPMPTQTAGGGIESMPCRGNHDATSYGCSVCSCRAQCQVEKGS
jgi:hypothetical protein